MEEKSCERLKGNQMIKNAFIIWSIIFLGFINYAEASYPFCIVRNNAYFECIYDSTDTCRQAIEADTNTYCIVSPEVQLRYVGADRYCVVDSNLIALCRFTDRGQCNSAARSRQGICADRELTQTDVDPYVFDERIQR